MTPVEALVRMPWELADVSPQTPVLLALSGGADSRFLLHVLSKGAERDGFPILLAHVHHGIRGETADRDCEFCLSLAARYGLPIEVLRADVPTLAREHGRGLEEEARAVRYEFFGRLMRERGIHLLATAHQADDLLETMLFRMARGTGGGGLCAIPRVRKFGEGWLTRPLLELTAAEKKLVELYRAADSETRKKALAVLKGEDVDSGDILSTLIGSALDMFGKK